MPYSPFVNGLTCLAIRRWHLGLLPLIAVMLILPLEAYGYQGRSVGTTSGQFSVDPSGTASYSIPITVPPGTAGMAPQVSLNYSSQSGYGLMGKGWNLSTGESAISRCATTYAQDGFYDGVDYDGNDKLCLNGQRLILVDGSYGASGAEYRTEIDSFSRIKQYGAISSTSSWFTVKTKAGITSELGRENNSRSVDYPSGQAPKVMLWQASKVMDTAGNYMRYHYQRINNIERLLRIEYTGNTSAGSNPYASVELIYNNNRPDPMQAYSNGLARTTNHRIARVMTKVQGSLVREYLLDYELSPTSEQSLLSAVTECAESSGLRECLPSTNFDYTEKNQGWSEQASWRTPSGLTETDGEFLSQVLDINGDGRPDWISANENHRETWINTGSGWQSSSTHRLPHKLSHDAQSHGVLQDINGDALPDLVVSHGGDLAQTWLNDKGRGWTQESPAYRIPSLTPGSNSAANMFHGDGSPEGQLVDLNADGLLDYVRARQGEGREAWLNRSDQNDGCTSSGCIWERAPAKDLPDNVWLSQGERQAILIDLDGDGLIDMLKGYKGNRGAWRNTGAGWVSMPEYIPPSYLYWGSQQHAEVFDVNGDGLNDIIYSNDDKFAVYLNRGLVTQPSGAIGSNWFYDDRYALDRRLFQDESHKRRGVLADVNHDGLVDAVFVRDGNLVETYINRAYRDCSTRYCKWDPGQVGYDSPVGFLSRNDAEPYGSISDINGDGMADIVLAMQGRGVNSRRRSYLSTGNMPDMLSKITNGLGSTVDVKYGSLSDTADGVYSKTQEDSKYPLITHCAAAAVVSEFSADDGLGGSNTTRYRYRDGRVNLRGRGILGFGRIEVEDVTRDRKEVTHYRQDFPFIGMPSKVESFIHGDIL